MLQHVARGVDSNLGEIILLQLEIKTQGKHMVEGQSKTHRDCLLLPQFNTSAQAIAPISSRAILGFDNLSSDPDTSHEHCQERRVQVRHLD